MPADVREPPSTGRDVLNPLISPPPSSTPAATTDELPGGSEESDSTLVHSPQSPSDASPPAENDVPVARPRLSVASAKFQTERPRPVGSTGSFFELGRRATASPRRERSHWFTNASNNDWSSSSENSSSDEEGDTSPSYPRPSLRRLNTIKRMPTAHRTKSFNSFHVGNEEFQTKGRVSKKDGRVKISLKDTAKTGYLAKALDATIHHQIRSARKPEDETFPQKSSKYADLPPPKLNILIAIIGSRGDIQPFIKIAKLLKDQHGHRVRFATHPVFRYFIEKECGLEFFSLGGDPSELMAFMVKNPGLIPSLDTVKKGEIGRRRQQMLEMFQGFWRACINATDDEKDVTNLKMMGDKFPFVADAIIANPPSFAHYHCAERLAIPLHLMFTFPYTPTQAFPHPLANIKQSNVEAGYTNFMSYPLVELMTWQGLGDLVNNFRVKTLGLEEVSTLWAPGQTYRMKVPHTYLWSPGLVPKPEDWGSEITIAGYVFLDLAQSFTPPEGLSKFLAAGDEHIYIGFGSIAGIDDPLAFTNMLFEAVKIAGVRALISKGWGGVGVENAPANVYMIDNIPHDWLFPRVSAVVHHGGAGTTAAGLKFGKPTLIVPFFGDQPFWAQMIAHAGAGASNPIPYKALTSENLAGGIKECLQPEAKSKAREIAASIEKEGDGAENAVKAFHDALPLTGEHCMRCQIFPTRVAVWQVRGTDIKLSELAAELLTEMKRLRYEDLDLARNHEWTDFHGPGEPITGASGALVKSFAEAISGVSNIPRETKREIRQHKGAPRTYSNIGKGISLPGHVAREKVNQLQPPGARLDDLAHTPTPPNLGRNAEPIKLSKPLTDAIRVRPKKDKRQNHGAQSRMKPPSGATGTQSHSLPTSIVILTAHGIGHSVVALANVPFDFGYAVTRGFHNAPRLYGDDTVRQSRRIDGFQSGLNAIRDELGYGFVDGVTGLVRLPYRDVKRDGPIGFVTGMSKGLGGLVLKPITGVLSVPTYLGRGMQVQTRQWVRDTKRTERWIRRARMVGGSVDVKNVASRTTHPFQQADALKDLRQRASQGWKRLQERQPAETAKHRTKRSISISRARSRKWSKQ